MMNLTMLDLKKAATVDRNGYILRKAIKMAVHHDISNDQTTSLELRILVLDAQIGSGSMGAAASSIFRLDPLVVAMDNAVLTARFLLAKGNFMQMQGHIIEALEIYQSAMEKALGIADEELILNIRIWREMALLRFFEPTALKHIDQLLATLGNQPSSWQKSMLAAHYAIGCWRLNIPLELDQYRYLSILVDADFPGPTALFLIASVMLDRIQPDPEELNRILKLVVRTQGIKGDVMIIEDFHTNHKAKLINLESYPLFTRWMERYFDPLKTRFDHEEKSLFDHLPDTPKMSPTSCLNCDNRCCYDGVYVTYAEEKRIREYIALHKEEFTAIPDDFLEKGEWEFLFGGNRTIRVPHEYNRSDYPAHFEKTICVFALPDGSCSLQRSAVKNGLHPWSIKPELCWEFPLIGLFNDDAIEHPHYFGQPDPHYFDESQPGYLSFLPCSKTTEDGLSWKVLYKNELQYYLAKKSRP